jgi:hypothetical protein
MTPHRRSQRSKRKTPHGLDFPLTAQDMDRRLNGKAMMNLHWGAPGLQICAYFTDAICRYTMGSKYSARARRPDFAFSREPHMTGARK